MIMPIQAMSPSPRNSEMRGPHRQQHGPAEQPELDRHGENLIVRIDWCFAGSAGFADLGAAEFFRDRAGTVADEGSLADDPPRLLQEFEMLSGRGGGVGVEIPAQVRHRIDDARAQIKGIQARRTGERAGNHGGGDCALEAKLPVAERDHEQRRNKERCAARRDKGDIGKRRAQSATAIQCLRVRQKSKAAPRSARARTRKMPVWKM
jgi:hypothetical protein